MASQQKESPAEASADANEELNGFKAFDRSECKSLSISYRDPLRRVLQTEGVFLDPRDAWRADAFTDVPSRTGKPTGGNLMLVSTAAVECLQRQADNEVGYARSTKVALDACRRDFLREEKRLVAELEDLARRVPRASQQEARDLIRHATELAMLAKEGGEAVVGEEEAEQIAKSVGPPGEIEDMALSILKGAGFQTSDQFTIRLLLRRLVLGSSELSTERDRLRALIEAQNTVGPPVDLYEAMLELAEKDGTRIIDLLMALMDMTQNPADRQKIEDKCGNGIKANYEKLVKRRQEIEPQLAAWKERLQVVDERRARAKVVETEVAAAERKLEAKMSEEREQNQEWERKRLERHARRTAKREAHEAKKAKKRAERDAQKAAMRPDKSDPNPDIDVRRHMTKEERDRLYKDERAVEAEYRRMDASKQRVQKIRSEVQACEDSIEEARQRRGEMQQEFDFYQKEVGVVEALVLQHEALAAKAGEELKEIKMGRNALEDAYAAATMAPPSEADIAKALRDIEKQKQINEELREEEQRHMARAELYENRMDRTENALRAKQEEEAAEEFYKKLAKEEGSKKRAPVPVAKRSSNPLALDYHERVAHPEFKSKKRHQVLYQDEEAREMTRARKAEDAAAGEAARLDDLDRAKTEEALDFSEGLPPPSPTPSPGDTQASWCRTPVNFRRREDLRVRLARTTTYAEQLADDLQIQAERYRTAHEALRQAGRQLGARVSAASRLQGEGAEALRRALDGAAPGLEEGPDAAVREALHAALAEHGAASGRHQELWHLAELACERGATEASLLQEGAACSESSENLAAASRRLAEAAKETTRAEDRELVAASRQYLNEVDDTADRLAAACAERDRGWPAVASAAEALQAEREAQDELRAHLRVEEQKKILLDAELVAPPEARAAVAAARAAAFAASSRK